MSLSRCLIIYHPPNNEKFSKFSKGEFHPLGHIFDITYLTERERHACVHANQEVASGQPDPGVETPRTLTFAELQALVEQGRTDDIPNNRQIPDAINEAPPSQSNAPQRKKPREIAL